MGYLAVSLVWRQEADWVFTQAIPSPKPENLKRAKIPAPDCRGGWSSAGWE
jgi:hypothetical protein